MAELNDKPDINAVLEHYGMRTKDRRSYMTNCPFHTDRTPSLSVNTDKNVFNCMSCGQAGSSFDLIMRMENTDFAGAREFASSLGLSTGGSGGGSDAVRGGYYSGRRSVPPRKGTGSGKRAYVPAWRRD